MFPSSKKKRLCRVNRPVSVDRGILVSVGSTDKLNGWDKVLSPVIPLDKSEVAEMISEEMMVDAHGDSGVVIGVATGCWSTSGLGCTYGLILPVLMEGLV